MRKLLRNLLFVAFCTSSMICSYANSSQANSFSAEVFASHVSCYGQKDGSLDLQISGGVAPYTFNWSTGATTEDVNGLPAGSYSVTVTDANGLITNACIDITQPKALQVVVDATESVCDGGVGEATVSVNGGTAPYTYSWSNDGSGSSLGDLVAGSYFVTVTDANGCSVTKDFSISEGGGFEIAKSFENVSCFGNYDGSAVVSVSGSSSYSFEWSNGATTAEITNLFAGIYYVNVTDEAGCVQTDSVTISEPSDIILVTDSSLIPCIGGSIDATVTGGTPPYKYYWSTGARTEDVSGLSNGNYFLRVLDNNGCMKSSYATIDGFNPISLTRTVDPVSCNSDNDGSINLTVTGGTAPYSFSWSNGATSEDVTGLSSGNYSVTVTDANNCTEELTVNVPKDDPFKFQINQNNISCNNGSDGSIELVSEGDTDLSYSWSNGDTGPTTTDLSEGEYSVIITSPEGCTKEQFFVIENPPALALSLDQSEDACRGGSLDLSVIGGSEPYTFNWSNGQKDEDLNLLDPGTYKVVVTDINGCKDSAEAVIEGRTVTRLSVSSTKVSCFGENDGTAKVVIDGSNGPYLTTWSNGDVNEEITDLAKGTYTATVTDNSGCTYTASTNVIEPAAISVYLYRTNPTCADSDNGVVRSLVNGGTPAFAYSWNTGATSSMISNLGPGNYSLTVTDKNGCTGSSSATLTAPEAISATIVSDNSCEGGTADVTVSGGQGSYTFLWSDGGTEEDRSNLSAGSYSVTVTDSKACSISFSTVVPTYNSLDVTVQVDGFSATANTAGGIAPYTYSWSGGQSTGTVNNLSEGTYTVVVTDVKGCSDSATFEVESLGTEALSATIDCCQDEDICKGEIASIPVHFTGQGPFTFTYYEGKQLKTVTTTDNPYYIESALYSTTTFKINSVSNGCSSGTVCGQATIGVNDCEDKCSFNCFSAEVTQVIDNEDCREVTMKILNNGSCRNGLSHLSVSVPCGKVKDVSNSRRFKTEYGTDPTSSISGFKLDGINNFGEAKDGKEESFYVTYTICKEGEECFGDFCPPMLAFKASTCVYYTKATYVPNPGSVASTDAEVSSDNISVYPNPVDKSSELKIQLPKGMSGQAEVTVVDGKGTYVLTNTETINKDDSTISLKLPVRKSGVYFIMVRKDDKQYSQKVSIR